MAIGSFQSDDFNSVALDPRWLFVDPLSDGSLALTGTGTEDAYLELSVPAGSKHDLWRGSKGAVRAMQAATNSDFEVETKFASEPSARYQIQGILIEQDSDNWLRFDTYYDGSALKVFAGATTNRRSRAQINIPVSSGAASYLRVSRQGNQWTFSYSADGVNWNIAGSFSHELTVSSVGTFAGNAGNLPEFTAQVDYFFNTAAPIDPEDGFVTEPPSNSAPDAINDIATVAPSSAVTIDVLANDSDADGMLVASSIAVVDAPTSGTVTINSDGTVTYLNTDPSVTSDSFTYTVEDNQADISNVATVALTIAEPPPNVAPQAGDDSAAVVSNSEVVIDVLANDSDIDGTLITNTVTVVDAPTNGTAVVNGDGTITYTNTNALATSDSFTYTVEDDDADTSNAATVVLTIAEPPPNVAPQAENDVVAASINSEVSINVLANDSDPDGTVVASTITVVDGPNNGSYSFNSSTGEIIYTPSGGFTGTDSLTYTVSDEDGAVSNLATAFITVGGEGPLIDVWYGLNQEFGQIGLPQTWVNILGNVFDVDGVTSLSYSLNGGSAVTLSIGSDGRRLESPGDFNIDIAYADLDGSSVDDLVTITATDSLGNVSTQTVTVDYEAGNTWPEQYSLDWSTAGSIQNVAQVVDGKWAIETGGLRISEPGYDRLVAIGDVSWSEYEVTVPITVNQFFSNSAGVGIALRWTGHTDDPISGFQPKTGWQPLGGIGWYRNRKLGIATTQQTHNRNDGGVKPLQEGVTYNFKFRVEGIGESLYSLKVWEVGEPEPSNWDVQYGEDSSRPQNGSAMLLAHRADVTFGDVTIIPISSDAPNQFPTANDDTTIAETSQSIIIDVLSNDVDSDGALNLNSVTVVNGPVQGTTVVNGDGSITYTHTGTSPGTDSLTYTVNDNDGATSNPATVNISIENPLPNQAPTAEDDSSIVEIADEVIISVLSNDSDSDGSLDLGSVTIISAPSQGTAIANVDGTVTYTHTGIGTGTDNFTYTVDDNDGDTASEATVTLAIIAPPPNQPPVASDDSEAITPFGEVIIDVLSNDSDSDGTLDPGSVNIATSPSQGTAIVNSDGTISYTHTGTDLGTDSFTYTVNDDDGTTSSEAVVNVAIEEPSGLAFDSDDFSNGLLGQQWTVVDPVGDSSYLLGTTDEEAYLELTVPQGTDHDAWQTNNAVRAMQVASDEDFEIEVKFLSEPNAKFQIQGILIEQDADNWIRFDIYHDGRRLRVFSAVTISGVSQTQVRNRINSGEGAYLRVNRQGDTWRLEHSANGVTWQTAGGFSHSLVVNSVGTFAGNTGPAPAFSAQVDYFFNTVAPIVPEDEGVSSPSNQMPTEAQSPIALDDTFMGLEDQNIIGNVLVDNGGGADNDPNGDILTVTAGTFVTSQGATLTILESGDFSYSPVPEFSGVDTFLYTVSDGLLTSSATASFTIEPVNDAPQIVESSLVKHVVDPTMSATHAVVTADFDNDNDIDIVATNFTDGLVAWYENDGQENFTKRLVDDNLLGAYPVNVGDVNGDGNIDILATGYDSDTVVWYENDSVGNFTRRTVDITANGAHSIVSVDIDSDGDTDLLTTQQDAGTVTWYENDGSETFVKRTIAERFRKAKYADPVDVDGDGDIDLFGAGNRDDLIVWFENDGNENFSERVIDSNSNGAYFVFSTDLNDDGFVDVVSASQNDDIVAWYRNDGNGSFAKEIIDNTADGARSVYVIDFDGDGNLDVLSASANNSVVALYRQNGQGNFSKDIIDNSALGAYGVFASDVNSDGLVDVLVASRDDNTIAWYEKTRINGASVISNQTLVIDRDLLQARDIDNLDTELLYTVTDFPDLGYLQLEGAPLGQGSFFTQDDVNGGALAYIHTGGQGGLDSFTYSLVDSESNGNSVSGTFDIQII